MEEAIKDTAVEEMPQGDTETHETDWKAEARKWEARAKKSQAAEQELAALKEAQLSEQEKAVKRAEAAENELAALKAEAERLASAREIGEKEGVPSTLLEFCSDAEAMEKFVEAYKKANPVEKVHAAASAYGSKVNKDGGKPSTREQFAQFAAQQFNR